MSKLNLSIRGERQRPLAMVSAYYDYVSAGTRDAKSFCLQIKVSGSGHIYLCCILSCLNDMLVITLQ